MLRPLLYLALCLTTVACNQPARVVVEPPVGPISGYQDDGVVKFLGIPYAQSTAGPNRWRAPVPMEPWNEVFDASNFGPWCPQFDFERRDEGEVHAAEGWTIFQNMPPDTSSDEDCLSLNVFAPPISGPPKPVMVFLPGNALGSSFPLYDGTDMAESGVVYVSINYRLLTMGIFAHPSLTAEALPLEPLGRFSEMDRIAALRWVQENIGAFGGDPSRVTLAGNSEGGAAVLQLLGNAQAQGLFHQAIVQSGNGWWSPMNHSEHEQFGCYIAEMSGVEGCQATAEELRSLAWPTIPVTGPYTIDNRAVSVGATQAIESGETIDVPLLIGWNDFDGSSLRYEPEEVISHAHPDILATYDQSKSVEDLAYDIYTDLHSGAPARWVAHKLEEGSPVYLYLFSYVVSWEKGSVRGAEHAYEIPHVLNTFEEQLNDYFPFLASVLLSDEDRSMTQIMHHCWVSFVKDGKPKCPNAPDWPRYERAADQLMELNLNPKVLTGYRAVHLDAQERHKSHYLNRVRESIRELIDKGES